MENVDYLVVRVLYLVERASMADVRNDSGSFRGGGGGQNEWIECCMECSTFIIYFRGILSFHIHSIPIHKTFMKLHTTVNLHEFMIK